MRPTLKSDALLLDVDPFAGGCVRALKYQDIDILRPGPDRIGPAYDPLCFGAFTMVPFVGRIHHAKLHVNGEIHQLPQNFPPEPHAIHGHGWQSAWQVESQSDTTLTLVYAHTADAWPWPYTARQIFDLTPQALSVTLSLTNRGDTPMPCGFGWHPYFYRDGAKMRLPSTHVWTPNEVTGDNVPALVTSCTDLSSLQTVADLNLDTTFSVSADPIQLQWPTHRVVIQSDPVFGHATVYVPPGQDYFCVEPVTQAPNAMHSRLPEAQTGSRWLAPKEKFEGTIRLLIET